MLHQHRHSREQSCRPETRLLWSSRQRLSHVLRYRLASQRLGGVYMNKFHVNIPAASQPRSVSIVSRGKVLDKETIAPVTEKLTFTVNGIPITPGVAR